MSVDTGSDYVHALRYQWLNRFYNPVVAATTREQRVKQMLVTSLVGNPGSVLDVASGTGTLTRALKQSFSLCRVVGVDGDKDMLHRAVRSAGKAHLEIGYDYGVAQALPYKDGTFDALVSSLFFHHLVHEDKAAALRECYRVTRPAGQLVIADWGAPQNLLMRSLFFLVRCLDGFDTTKDNVQGQLPVLVERAGYSKVRIVQNIGTPLGTISIITAAKE